MVTCKIFRLEKGIVYPILFLLIGAVITPTYAESSRNILYVDDDAPPEWYDATHVRTIQEGINNATEDDTIIVYNGTYQENILINKPVTLRGEHQNTTIIDGNETHAVVRVAANRVTITGFTIQNCKRNYQGVYLSSSDFCTISGNTIVHNEGNGIQLRSSEHNIITSNFIEYNWRGITFEPFSNHNIISGNRIGNNQQYSSTTGIVLMLSRNNTISNNAFIGNNLLIRSSYQSIITDNTFTSKGICLDSESSGDYFSTTIENNTVNGKAIRFYKLEENMTIPENTAQVILLACTNMTVTNLTFSDVDIPVHLVLSQYCTIAQNTITGAETGVLLYYMCRNNDIVENIITQNEYGIVIEYWSPEKNTIRGNIIQGNDEHGIALYGTTDSIIEENIISGNANGIHLEEGWGPCSNNTIIRNLIRDNREKGVRLFSVNDNILKWNTIQNNDYGIFIPASEANVIIENTIIANERGIHSGPYTSDNILYHNNFLNNMENAYDSGNNVWENMFLREGNYWSDFEENPGYPLYYVIPGGMNRDNYPLSSPFEAIEIFPDNYSIVQGKYVSGDVSDLYESDDQRLVIKAGLVITKIEPPVWVEIEGTAPICHPQWLNFTVEAKVNSVNIGQRINLYNYEKQSWDELDFRSATTIDQVVSIVITENPSQYIDPDTRGMRAQLTWKPIGPTLFFPWQVSMDQAVWNSAIFIE